MKTVPPSSPKTKTGLNTSRDLKLPFSIKSLAGFTAFSLCLLNIADVYDDEALRMIHPTPNFLKEVDKRSGYRTKQMLVVPVIHGADLFGVLQVTNNKSDRGFGALEVEGALQLCKTLATAIRQRVAKGNSDARRKSSRYDGLVAIGALTVSDLIACEQEAKAEGKPLEQLLVDKHQITLSQIGLSLARFFGAAYEPFDNSRKGSDTLHGKLKREFIEQQGWIPLDETADGLAVLCLDPAAVRASRVLNQVFPKSVKFAYCCTTGCECEQTISLLYAPNAETGSIDQLLADLSPTDDETLSDDMLESAAADNELVKLVKLVNKVIVDAHHQKASDIHIEPQPGKEKTGIRFRVDGNLIPYIEVPAHCRQAMTTRLKIMCDLDISEKRKLQDGKIVFKKYGPLDIELRVATIPSYVGVEDVVMRILAGGEPIPLEKLGLTPHNKQRLEKTVTKPYGLF